jgi:hypothetical protein
MVRGRRASLFCTHRPSARSHARTHAHTRTHTHTHKQLCVPDLCMAVRQAGRQGWGGFRRTTLSPVAEATDLQGPRPQFHVVRQRHLVDAGRAAAAGRRQRKARERGVGRCDHRWASQAAADHRDLRRRLRGGEGDEQQHGQKHGRWRRADDPDDVVVAVASAPTPCIHACAVPHAQRGARRGAHSGRDAGANRRTYVPRGTRRRRWTRRTTSTGWTCVQ